MNQPETRVAPSPAPTTTPLRLRDLVVFLLILLPYFILVHRFWFVCDDAFISFRYARNLAEGHGLRYNLDKSPPVEGYSNFLWTLLCAVFEYFNLDITLWPLVVSVLCGVALLALVYVALRRRLGLGLWPAAWATLTLACFPPFALWSTSGLETMPFALLLFIAFDRLILRSPTPDGWGGGVAALLLALLRVEGIAWAGCVIALAAVSRIAARPRFLRPLVTAVLVLGVGYATYFAGRYAYYQEPFPNTVHAKAKLDSERLERGANYVLSFVLTFLTPVLIIPGTIVALRRGRLPLGLAISAMAWAFPIYSVLVTGDFMAMGRFLLPGLAFNTLLLGWLLAALHRAGGGVRAAASAALALAAIATALLPAWDLHVVPLAWRERARFRFNTPDFVTEYIRWRDMAANARNWSSWGRALRRFATERLPAGEPVSVVLAGIGGAGYYSRFHVYDQYGLVTPEVGRRELLPGEPLRSPGHDKFVSWEHFIKDKPTILLFWLLSASNAREAAALMQNMAENMRQAPQNVAEKYALDFARAPEVETGEFAFLLAFVRIPDGVSARHAWAEFEARIDELSHLTLK